MKIKLTAHARFEASRRGISEGLIKSVVKAPQQKLPSKKGRIVVQKKYYDKIEGKEMLLRVIGIETEREFKVITAYKTSKVDKYWVKGG